MIEMFDKIVDMQEIDEEEVEAAGEPYLKRKQRDDCSTIIITTDIFIGKRL